MGTACALFLAPGLAPAAVEYDEDLARYVDPLIGTLGSGFVVPGAAMPFGMVQLSPDTNGYFAYTGYLWSDAFIRGFSHVHVSGMGVRSAGDLPFLPTVGPVSSSDPNLFQSAFDHASERAEPGYYRVRLDTYAIDAELAAGLRVGLHRYAFPPVPQANVLLDVGRSVPGVHFASVELVGEGAAEGTAHTTQGYEVHFAARFSQPFAGFGAWQEAGQAPVPGERSAAGVGAGAYVSFDATLQREVLVKVGISFVSRANALLNLEAELPGEDFGFDVLRGRARAAWNGELHRAEVEGSELDKRSFYTALYHAFQHPNVFTDADGEYMGHDGRVHVAEGYVHHANFAFWDTYRGENQLLALLQPERYRDMVRSLAAMAREAGRLPRWSLMNTYPDYMPGEPALIALGDAFCRGLVPQELEQELYAAMRTLALERRRDPSYLVYGYVPHDVNSGGASATLEHALGDFALALVADRLGLAEDRDTLLRLSENWRNLLDPDTRFVRPRYSDGSWLSPYLPELPQGFVEGTGWQYTWLVPHDVRGLSDAMGGGASARERLDTFLAHPLAAVPGPAAEVQKALALFGVVYAGNQYAPSNEHDLQAPYLYDYVGQPWKTQAVVRGLQALYRPLPDGLPGNDDLGTMSAWYAWSALGLYPMPGSGVLLVGSPVFERAVVHLEGARTLELRAPGASPVNKYVQAARLDGAPLERAWLTHDAIVRGGALELALGPLPNEAWASAPGAGPPALSTHPVAAFGCTAGWAPE